MTRNIFIFLGTFIAGAVIALVVRAAAFKPHAGHESLPAAGGEYAAMVSNPLIPANAVRAKPDGTTPAQASPAAAHANHATAAAKPPARKPVNTVCAICGMAVDPSIPTAEYQGKTIGFGCKMCPPKFKANPDRYGPLYLKNEVAKRG